MKRKSEASLSNKIEKIQKKLKKTKLPSKNNKKEYRFEASEKDKPKKKLTREERKNLQVMRLFQKMEKVTFLKSLKF